MKQFTQQIDNANVWVEEFDSLADNLMYAKDNKKRKESDTKSPEKFKWTGSADLDSAVDMGLAGWHEIRLDFMASRLPVYDPKRFGRGSSEGAVYR